MVDFVETESYSKIRFEGPDVWRLTNIEPSRKDTMWSTNLHPAPENTAGYPDSGLLVEYASVKVQAKGGKIGPFRYLLRCSGATGRLYGWYPMERSLTLLDGETFTLTGR